MPDIAAQFFGLSVGSRQVVALVRDTLQELVRSGHVNPVLRERLAKVEETVAQALGSVRGGRERVDWPELPDAFIESLHAAVAAIDALRQALKDTGSDDAGLKACLRRCDSLVEGLGEMLALGPEDGVRWVDVASRSFTLGFSPFEVAGRLRELMTSRPCAWVFTSATLAIGEDFAHFLDRIGATGARTLRVQSPFDFERQAMLYLPQGLPDPSDRSHTAAVLAAALPLVEAADGRAFLLFTSHRALKEAARVLRLRDGFEERFPMLVQGEAPRESLLARFRAEPHSVLLGTSSFWEGVDVRGTSLVLVVIDKLPFASPDDPLLKARLEGIRRRDGNPFFEYQVPQAVLALKQGFGRLIRDREDFGVVVICDPRLRTKSYGRLFLQALPPARLTREGDEAVAFLEERLAEAGIDSRRRGAA